MHFRQPARIPPRYRPLGAIDPTTGLDSSTGLSASDMSAIDSAAASDGSTSTANSTTPSWLNTLVTGATQFMLGQQQAQRINQLNAINIQRAQQGLPPISVDMAGPGVSVGVSSGVQTAMYIGLGIAGLFVLTQMFKRR
jgi:hypothetical protein